ncbi:uncharacterized protein LOC129740075 [Uranotaenia lowii]|uniref:uncharacterized protein LOC129740075 n=1 Tax=Uranotaenia lowii TaxID=190385 RepID=UPI002479DE0E|nr:uncharacterized protein LOC129740075 [Uranotaenia lowii]
MTVRSSDAAWESDQHQSGSELSSALSPGKRAYVRKAIQCRLCLRNLPKAELEDIFSELDFYKEVRQAVDVEVNRKDRCIKICPSCLNLVKMINDFRDMCSKSVVLLTQGVEFPKEAFWSDDKDGKSILRCRDLVKQCHTAVHEVFHSQSHMYYEEKYEEPMAETEQTSTSKFDDATCVLLSTAIKQEEIDVYDEPLPAEPNADEVEGYKSIAKASAMRERRKNPNFGDVYVEEDANSDSNEFAGEALSDPDYIGEEEMETAEGTSQQQQQQQQDKDLLEAPKRRGRPPLPDELRKHKKQKSGDPQKGTGRLRYPEKSETDVELIFSTTMKGRQLMLELEEATKPTCRLLTQTTHILCDYLSAVYGLRPSAEQKDNLAIAVVNRYPIFASKVNPDCPQSVFFHRNARMNGGHTGKIQNRMESLAKQDTSRMFVRRPRQQAGSTEKADNSLVSECSVTAEELLETLNELKYIKPSLGNEDRIRELWDLTFERRNQCRKNKEMLAFLKEYPILLAFNGDLISYDYEKIHNIDAAAMFGYTWPTWEKKTLNGHRTLYREIGSGNGFLRALAIIRLKTPNRGSRQARQENEALENPLRGVIDWITNDSELPTNNAFPSLVVRSEVFSQGVCYLCWNSLNIPLGDDLKTAFVLLLQCFEVFAANCCPADNLFYNFFHAIIFNTQKISTTGEKFVFSVS